MTPYKGHTLFELNCDTNEIVKAKFEEVNANIKGAVRKKVIIKPNCLYISCLNEKSARKKFAKYMFENALSKIHDQFNNK
jgi:hypothetical protein